jgi:hypothetical protein
VREVQNFHPASRGDSQNSQNRPISNRSHGRDHDLKAARNWARSRACKPLVSKTVTRRQGVSRVRIPPPPLSSRKRLQEARIQIRDQLSMRPVRLASDAEAPRISCLSPNEPIARRSRGCGSPGPQAAGNAKEVAGEAIDKDDLAREAAVPRVTQGERAAWPQPKRSQPARSKRENAPPCNLRVSLARYPEAPMSSEPRPVSAGDPGDRRR